MFIVGLIHNAALLVALSALYGLWLRFNKGDSLRDRVILGCVFGGMAVIAMTMPVYHSPGVIYDGRSMVLAMAGLFGGGITGAVAAAIALVYRIWLGGPGVWAGMAVIVCCTACGVVFRRYSKTQPYLLSPAVLYLFGVVVHIVTLACQLLLPRETALLIISQIALPVLLVFPVGTLLIGLLLSNEERRSILGKKLVASEGHLRTTIYSVGDGVIATDCQGRVTILNPVAEALTGWTQTEAAGRPLEDVFNIVNGFTKKDAESPVARVLKEGKIVGLANHTLLISRDGRETAIADSAAPIRDEQGNMLGVVMVFRDQTEERLARRLMEVRIGLINYAMSHTVQELLTKVLDEIGALVNSPVGFYHFVEPDQNGILMQQWSTRTLKEFCSISDEVRGRHYPIDSAGVWADCIREKRPIIHNDYASLPHKKGLPKGHSPLIRELTAPVMRDGRVVAVLGVGNKPTNYTEKDVEIVTYLADVTWQLVEHKRVEEQNRRYSRVMEESLDEIYIFDAKTLHFLEVNLEARRNLGYSMEELRGMTPLDIKPEMTAEAFERLIEPLKTGAKGKIVFITVHQRKDGSLYPVEIHLQLMAGEQPVFVAFIFDITERKRTERDITIMKTALDNIKEAIFLIDKTGHFRYVNREAWQGRGYTLDELLAMTIMELDPDMTAEKWLEHRGRLKDKRSMIFNARHRTKDGRIIPVEINTNYFEYEGEGFNLALVRDITQRIKNDEERRSLEGQLRQAQKMEAIGTLAGGIAHDFNNILTVIIGFAEIAKMRLEPDSPVQGFIHQILQAGDRAKELVKQILTFSRRSEQERRPLQINLLIKESLKLLHASIPSTITIREDIDSNAGMVMADPTQIHQILMNLCTNAYHAMRETGGELGITLKPVEITEYDAKVKSLALAPGSYVRLEVSDTGCGMTKETMERIFEPYFTTKPQGEGTGLGLAIVHGIVKNSGGHISVYSEPGRGTTFKIYLPCIQGVEKSNAKTEATAMERGTAHVLVVDDENDIVDIEKDILEALGYRVTGFTSSQKAFEAVSTAPAAFDLVISDMTMPEMTGVELFRRIQGVRPGLPFILCTGFSELIDKPKAIAMGIDAFLEKPLHNEKLAETVAFVLRNKK